MARKSRKTVVSLLHEEKQIYLAGFYARLSDESVMDEEENSIGNQKKLGLEFIANNPDIYLVKEYADNGWTGTNFKRPSFTKLLSDIENKVINCVIVKDFSRLGRNDIEVYAYIEQFIEKNVRFISILDNFDTAKGGELDDTGVIFKNIINGYYPKDFSIKIRSSIQRKMNEGEYLPSSSSVPYGYLRNGEKLTYDIDQEVSGIVRRIFEMRSSGKACTAIAKYLESEGIPSPGRLRFLRGMSDAEKYKNALWNHKTVRRILDDIVYLGHRKYGTYKRDYLGAPKQKKPEEEWNIINNTHPAIISEELFRMAHKMDEIGALRREKFEERELPEKDYRAILKGKVICGDCRRTMASVKCLPRKNGKGKVHISYECNTYLRTYRVDCGIHYTREEKIISSIISALNILLSGLEIPDGVRNGNRREEQDKQELCNAAAEIKRKEKQMVDLLQNYMDGVLSQDEYYMIRQEYLEEIEFLQEREKNIRRKMEIKEISQEHADELKAGLQRYQEIKTLDKDLIDLLVREILVYKGGRIEIVFNFADEIDRIMRKEVGHVV